MRKILVLVFSVLLMNTATAKKEVSQEPYIIIGKVVSVYDGDTFTVQTVSNKLKIRLLIIDCPEKNREYGKEATDYTKSKLLGKKITAVCYLPMNGKRHIALVYYGHKLFNTEILADGYGWIWSSFCNYNFCDGWRMIQDKAKIEDRGIW